MNGHETDSLLPGHKTTPNAATAATPNLKARRGLALVVAICGAAALAAVALPRANAGGGLRASPAALKAEALKSGLVKEVDKNRWLPECLAWWQMAGAWPTSENPDSEEKNDVLVSDYDLIAMPAGLCAHNLKCAWENCGVDVEGLPSTPATFFGDFDVKNGDLEQIEQAATGLKFNLPDQIAFPTSVKDVVDVVTYAKKASMPISVKTSGKSYHGSSTLAGSVNVNLRDFPKYSQIAQPGIASSFFGSRPAVQPCDMTEMGFDGPAACALALARGKPGVIRIGGGELWDDAYRAVVNANYLRREVGKDLYELFGGGAGSVSAAGGWMAGGGIGDGSERVHGVGVDNVLELEMVLPSGQHVKFAPSKWEDAPGFLYPKTTEVTGLCNKNVATDESEWQWEACEVEVPWEDLWHAVRGGGGGSYGIVTALTYQLHKRRELVPYKLDASSYTDVCPDTKYFTGGGRSAPDVVLPAGCKEVQDAFTDFWVDFLWDPAAIGLAEETSLNCGDTDFRFAIADAELKPASIRCYDARCVLPGPDGEYLPCPDKVWTTYWKNYTGPAPEGLDMDKWQKALVYVGGDWPSNWKIYPSVINTRDDYNWNPVGRVDSDKAELTGGDANSWSAIIPPAWFLQKNDDVHNAVMEEDANFHIMGGNVGKLHDQMTSLSEIYRIAGAQHQFWPVRNHHQWFYNTGEYWFPKVSAFYPEAPKGKLLGGTEYNHIGRDSFGPLKADHSAYCPRDLTHAEKEEQCVSLQEHVWGTDGLAKLEAIKAKVDPQGLFQCQKCVGFKGPVRDQ